MSGIVGAVSACDVTSHLINSLKILENKDQVDAKIFLINPDHTITTNEHFKKIAYLEKSLGLSSLGRQSGIANTHWQNENIKADINAGVINGKIVLVKNGLISNHQMLGLSLLADGYSLQASTDSEIISYLIYYHLQNETEIISAVRKAEKELEGVFSIILAECNRPDHIIALHRGSNLVIGLGNNENFIASDHTILLDVADKFIFLEEGDIADITNKYVAIYNAKNERVQRPILTVDENKEKFKKGKFKHLMLKEIHDLPDAIMNTLQGRINDREVFVEAFGNEAKHYFRRIQRVQIVGNGNDFHAGLIARYWFEEIAGIPCNVDIATDLIYRQRIVEPNTLFIALSQTREVKETLKALHMAKNSNYAATLTISHSQGNPLVGESDLSFITGAGTDRGEYIPTINNFSAQLTALLLLAIALGKHHHLSRQEESVLVKKLKMLPIKALQALNLNQSMKELAKEIAAQKHILLLGNGIQFPVAMEAALKLKETSLIHATAYSADQLGSYQFELGNVDTAVIAFVSSREAFLPILQLALYGRANKFIVFTDDHDTFKNQQGLRLINVPSIDRLLSPIINIMPMQLLAYYCAIMKGADVDRCRYSAKSFLKI